MRWNGGPMGAGMPPNGVGFRTGTPPPMRTRGVLVVLLVAPPPGSATTTGGRGGGFNSAGPPPREAVWVSIEPAAPPPRFAGGGRGPPGGASSTPGSTHQRDAIGRALPSSWKSQTPPAMAVVGTKTIIINSNNINRPIAVAVNIRRTRTTPAAEVVVVMEELQRLQQQRIL